MAGVYIHIPFCKSRCRYCDFYSTTQLDQSSRYIDTILREWEVRRSEIGTDIATIYIGGGTPSLLPAEAIGRLLRAIGAAPEITMEANPGDLTLDKLVALHQLGINRLSIGIQSFQDRLLRLIGRRHSAEEALEAVRLARQAGFDNLSIDLIYGLPTQSMAEWQEDIDIALSLKPEHISCYCLSYEENTPLSLMLERGEIEETDEDTENAMYDYLCRHLREAGYEHYEVSNFARHGYYSRHNSSYWDETPYVGLGAGAHSYDGVRRSFNRGDLGAYLLDWTAVREVEELSPEERYNEHVMLALRTAKGLDLDYVDPQSRAYIEEQCRLHLLEIRDQRIHATQQGLHILNRIIEELMII